MPWLRPQAFHPDENQKAIVSGLRKCGASVEYIKAAGAVSGIPDLLVGWRGSTYLLEVKRPATGPRGGGRGRVRPGQEEFMRTWIGGPVAVVHSLGEALIALGVTG